MTNLDKLLALLDGTHDAFLLTGRCSRMYAAQFDVAEGVAIVSKNGCRYFTDSRYLETAQKNIAQFEVMQISRVCPSVMLLNTAIAELGIEKLGYEENDLTAAQLNAFTQTLKVELVPAGKQINALRSVKEDWELAIMRRAQQVADRSFTDVLPKICAGMTEKQLQAELIYCLYKNGAERLSFDPIVVSGPNTSMPHGVATDRVIEKGDFITMDFGAVVDGYCSDMTRTVAVGYATDEMRKVYDTVLAAQRAGIAATKAGVMGKDIDAAARRVIEQAGYGAYFGHGYGHSLGMEVHECPNCNPSEETVMQENMICSAEPGIYIPGKFGVRIEDVVIFTADGCENITKSPKELMIV